MKKIMSRKFLLTLLIICLAIAIPILFKVKNISDSVTLAVLGLFGGIGAAYHIVNVKEAGLSKPEDPLV